MTENRFDKIYWMQNHPIPAIVPYEEGVCCRTCLSWDWEDEAAELTRAAAQAGICVFIPEEIIKTASAWCMNWRPVPHELLAVARTGSDS